jgi:hypothetical protein
LRNILFGKTTQVSVITYTASLDPQIEVRNYRRGTVFQIESHHLDDETNMYTFYLADESIIIDVPSENIVLLPTPDEIKPDTSCCWKSEI